MTVVESLPPAKCRKTYEIQIAQIKEITGVNCNEAWEALKEGSFDIGNAIQITINKQTLINNLERGTQKAPDGKNEVIDLTGEKDNDKQDEDIEKAIKLSLQETNDAQVGSMSGEQRDLNRALEASFNDSNPKRTRTDFWQTDVNANPHEQKRKENYPVGLRNVGNTCWFSAVVQSLFQIPAFRKTILQFGCSQRDDAESDPTVKELQKLFAFMIGSRRKHIDPSYVIQCLTDFFKVDLNQQDVIEFMVKLIDYLEGCFEQKCQRKEETVNPVVDMFYGRYTVEGRNAGQHFTKEETFGTYPLQIAKYKDLHESIEGAMVHSDVEPAELGTEETHSQEHWFTRLPAVLVLELSRCRFNQENQQPEKIHNKIEFEEYMYMDRYMQENKDIVRILREDINELKMAKINEPSALTNGDFETPTSNCEPPEPMEISGDEESPTDAKSTADSVYEREDLKMIRYKLHAVLVHEGEANGGHYWAFIYDTHNNIWRKFNDITVSDVTWEEVYRVSVGGSFNASAYCLIYTDTKRVTELYSVTDCYVAESLKKLVDEDNEVFEEELKEWDKKEATKAANQKTSDPRKVNGSEDSIMDSENMTTIVPAVCPEPKKNHRLKDSSNILHDLTDMITNAIDRYGTGNALKEWCEKEREKYQKRATEDLSAIENSQSDVRLEHQAIYFIKCDAPHHVTERTIYETFLQQTGEKAGNENSHNIRRQVEKNMMEDKVGELDEYKEWKNHYSNFQKASLAFIYGLDYLHSNGYKESLPYLTYAVKLNSQLPLHGQLNKDLLSRAVGLCLLKLNEDTFSMFSTGNDDDACKALDLMTRLVIPSMNMSDCSKVVEHIRGQWIIPCVEKSLGDNVQSRIEDFVHYLFEGNNTNNTVNTELPLLNCDLNCKTLSRKFSKVISLVNDSPQFLEMSDFK